MPSWVHKLNNTIDGVAKDRPDPTDGKWSQVADNDAAMLAYLATITAPTKPPDWSLLSSLLNASVIWTNLLDWSGKSLDTLRDFTVLMIGLGCVQDVTKLAASWAKLRTTLKNSTNILTGVRDFNSAELTLIRGFLTTAGFDPANFNLS